MTADGHHDHGTSALATLLGLSVSLHHWAAAASHDNASDVRTVVIGVMTAGLSWLLTRVLTRLERWWNERSKR